MRYGEGVRQGEGVRHGLLVGVRYGESKSNESFALELWGESVRRGNLGEEENEENERLASFDNGRLYSSLFDEKSFDLVAVSKFLNLSVLSAF